MQYISAVFAVTVGFNEYDNLNSATTNKPQRGVISTMFVYRIKLSVLHFFTNTKAVPFFFNLVVR